ncbi:hypothetical protein ACLB2K_030383 [Fragaria x ananassa]
MAAARVVPSANTILEVLNLYNYEDWSCRVRIYLKAKGLWEVVEATAETPNEEDTDKYRDWKKKNAKAHHAIQNSCGTDVFGFIRDSRTAKDAWATLAKMFMPASNKTAKTMVQLMTPEELEIPDPSGRTALSYGVSVQGESDYGTLMSAALAKCMVDKNERLLSIVDPSTNMIPLVRAHQGFFGRNLSAYLLSVTPLDTMCVHQAASLISIRLERRSLEIPMHLIDRYPSLGITEDLSGHSPLYTLADNIKGQFFNGEKRTFREKIIYDYVSNVPPINAPGVEDNRSGFEDQGMSSLLRLAVNPFGICGNYDDWIREQKILHVQALTLLDRICDAIRNKNVAEMQENSALRNAIFRAAETENVEFLRRMFKANERIAGITNGKDRTVLQYAAESEPHHFNRE